MKYEFATGPELDPETDAMVDAAFRDHQKAGGYFNSLRPSKEQIERIRENGRIHNLSESFYLWIDDAYGQFDIRQVYGDLGVTNPKDKTLIRVGLHRMVESGILERSKLAGTYRKVDIEVGSIEPLDDSPVPLPIRLPGDIEKYVDVYAGNVIIDAGSPNSGKTAYDLNVAIDNRDRFEVIYFTSEMGVEELTLRIGKFKIDRREWKKVQFKKRTQDFQDVIQPDALNIIDYLEVIEGEFYKIGDNIRKIYQKLNRGVALISLQMDRGAKWAWGGQKTLDKARLYMTLDKNELTIVKGKNRASLANPNGLVRPFKLVNGCDFRWEAWK